MFSIFSHPCEGIDVLTGVWTGTLINLLVEVLSINVRAGVAIDVLTDRGIDFDVGIIVVAAAVIVFEFVLSALCVVDVLTDVVLDALINALTGVTIGVVTGIVVGVLVDVNTNVLAGVMTPSELVISEPFSC